MRFRSIATVSAAITALVILLPTSSVQAQGRLGDPDRPSYPGESPRPDFPSAKQQDQSDKAHQPDLAQSPRPDFPGAKQPDTPAPSQK
jgi:hypothetical protein